MSKSIKNILHICGDFDRFHENLINTLKINSIDNKVLKYTLKHQNKPNFYSKDVLFYNNSIKIPWAFYFIRKLNNVMRWVVENVNLERTDIIHSHMLFSDGIVAYKISKKFGIPYIVTVRNTDLNTWFYWNLYWIRKSGLKALLNSDTVVFLSQGYMDRLIEKLPRKYREKIRIKSVIVPNAVDDFWFENMNVSPKKILSSSEIRVFTVGRIEKNKNQLAVKDALKILIQRGFNFKYTIIGDIVDKKMLGKLKKESFVKIIRSMNKEGLLELYRLNDIYVMPSITETFGLVYVEALTQGLPLIYSRGEGFDNQFPEGIVGYSVKSDSVTELVFNILKIVINYELISRNCVEKSKKFQFSSVAERYVSLYHDILKKKKG